MLQTSQIQKTNLKYISIVNPIHLQFSDRLLDRIIISIMSNNPINQPLLQSKFSSYSKKSQSEHSKVTQTGFFKQTGVLTYKNILITFKNPKNILFLIIAPFLLSLFLFGFQQLSVNNGNLLIPDPSASALPAFNNCTWEGCVSLEISFASINQGSKFDQYDWIKSVLESVKSETQVSAQIRSQPITSFADLQGYYGQLQKFPNRTQIGVLFCGDPNESFGNDSLANFCPTSNSINYTYYFVLKKFNSMGVIFHAIDEPFPIDPVASALKLSLDKAIINYSLKKKNNLTQPIDIAVQTGRFPLTHNRYIYNYDIITAIGAFYFMIPALFVFLFMQSEIVREKEYKLRQGLNIFGAKHSAYWMSWFIIAVFYSLLTCISSFLAGYAFGFNFFHQTPAYIIMFFLFFPFAFSMAMFGFMISTLAPTTNAANASSYAIVLLAIVVQSFVSDNNVVSLIFTDDASSIVLFLRYFLVFYPPFSYTKIFTNITVYSGFHFDIAQRAWVTGPQPYDYNIFQKSITGSLFTGGTFSRYSDLTSMGIMFADAAFFIILTWYFDNVISSNRGRGSSPLFPIYKLVGLFRSPSPKQKQTAIIKLKPLGQGEEESAIKERNRVYLNSEQNLPALGLRIKCLSKTFNSGCFSKSQLKALNQLTIQIEPGELMGVLGHNGAGKTTLINILTGVISPDEIEQTEIIINRQSITKMDEIRKHIGLCAQFDILWQELTAYQHLQLFASIKGVQQEAIPQTIKDLLEMVGLPKQAHNKVGGFSGGMKRRLSLAIASIGDPKIILLDQPTTGLDPKVRQQVWALIEKLKVNRSIILTTHSMEEADVLADRVCVMVKGKIRCVGSSLSLKQQYGMGHRLTLNVDKGTIQKVSDSLKKICPSSNVVDYKGGNLLIGIQQFENLLKVIKVLETLEPQGLEQFQLKKSIRDWSVSHATLEQVFMAVSKEKNE